MSDKTIIDQLWKGNIPEYMVNVFYELTNDVIPFWLRKSSINIVNYMAVGGRAANVQTSGLPIPSSDWDLLLFSSDKNIGDRFTKELADFIKAIVVRDKSLLGVVKEVDSFSTKVGKDKLLWRIVIIDKFSEVKFPIVDIKICPQVKGGKIGDFCNYNPVTIDGINYAPYELVKLDIERMSILRNEFLDKYLGESIELESKIEEVKDEILSMLNDNDELLELIELRSTLESKLIKQKLNLSNYELKLNRQNQRAQYFE